MYMVHCIHAGTIETDVLNLSIVHDMYLYLMSHAVSNEVTLLYRTNSLLYIRKIYKSATRHRRIHITFANFETCLLKIISIVTSALVHSITMTMVGY